MESEKSRRAARLGAHYRNDVWSKRERAPEDWNKPLPEYLQKEYESTYLYARSQEMKGEVETKEESSFCVLM